MNTTTKFVWIVKSNLVKQVGLVQQQRNRPWWECTIYWRNKRFVKPFLKTQIFPKLVKKKSCIAFKLRVLSEYIACKLDKAFMFWESVTASILLQFIDSIAFKLGKTFSNYQEEAENGVTARDLKIIKYCKDLFLY